MYNLHKLSNNQIYGSTNFTRPYFDYKSYKFAEKIFKKLKEMWNNQNLLIVEGNQTRLGVGNDLLSNSKSIKRILVPPENCYSKINEIFNSIIETENVKQSLVLLSLGPTATLLANKLSYYGIWAIDIGHIDIDYEWFKKKATHKDQIKNKYTNEAENKNFVADCFDEKYISQIIKKIE